MVEVADMKDARNVEIVDLNVADRHT